MSGHFHTKVVGVSHDNDDGWCRQHVIQQCTVGEAIWLIRILHNQFDPNAIGVFRTNSQQLGFLSADLAEELAPAMDGGEYATRGVNLFIQHIDAAI